MTGRVAIIGGGMLGSTLALRLAQRGAAVTIFEAGATLGGLAAPWTIESPRGSITWDRHYHVTLASDRALMALLAELGLDDDIHWSPTRTGLFADGRLESVSSPSDFLRLGGLSPVAKARLAATIGRGATTKQWRALEGITAQEWLTRWSGRATFERFWVPLLCAKLGDDWRDANAAFIWATIQRLTAARRSGVGDEQFGSVRGGYARVIGEMANRLEPMRVAVIAGTRVERITRTSGEISVLAAGARTMFDDVIVTASPRIAAGLIDGLADQQRAEYTAIRYQGVVCASMLLDEPVSPYYLTYLLDDMPFTGIVEMTTVIPRAWVQGYSLVYLPRYVTSDSPWFELSDTELADRFLAGLQRVHPGVGRSARPLVAWQVSRAREVFPLPVLRYSQRVPPFATSVPGVWMVNSAQIVNGTLNVNETVSLAERASRVIPLMQ